MHTQLSRGTAEGHTLTRSQHSSTHAHTHTQCKLRRSHGKFGHIHIVLHTEYTHNTHTLSLTVNSVFPSCPIDCPLNRHPDYHSTATKYTIFFLIDLKVASLRPQNWSVGCFSRPTGHRLFPPVEGRICFLHPGSASIEEGGVSRETGC